MPIPEHNEQVRRLVHETFLRLGAESGESCEETILLRDGFYCGRRFQCRGWRAVWLFERDEVKFFGDDGVTIQTVSLAGRLGEAERHAA